jgi:hypothetical protein
MIPGLTVFGRLISWKAIGITAGIVIVWAAAHTHMWKDSRRERELVQLRADKIVMEANAEDCAMANVNNQAAIDRLSESLQHFSAERDAALTRGNARAEALAEELERRDEETQQLRLDLQLALATERCTAVVLPDDASQLLNAAIKAACRDQDGDGR